MPQQQGIFIVLEGSDGSGKSTQFRLLSERLRAVGYDIEVFKFPQYELDSSHFIKKYLNGDYGPASEISPYTASLFYALDRYEAAPKIREALKDGKIVLADRYVGSNMAHQGSKFSDETEQRGFFVWDDGLEFQLLNIPRPTISLFLSVPVEISQKLMSQDKRASRGYTKETHDEHEKDTKHLRSTIKTYDVLCKLFPKDFTPIDCTKNNKLLDVATINNIIWSKLKPLLPPPPPNKGRDVIVNLEEKVAEIEKNIKEPAKDQATVVDDTQIQPNILSLQLNKISLLAISSIQNIDGLECQIQKIEWNKNNHNYYTQPRLPKEIANIYKASMDKIATLHDQMQINLNEFKSTNKETATAQNVLDGAIPLAALCSVKISGSTNDLLKAVIEAEIHPLDEVRWLAEQIRAQINKQIPNTLKPEKAQNTNMLENAIAKLVKNQLHQTLSSADKAVELLEALPRNEFDLLTGIIYPYSNLSKADIDTELETWTYEQKSEALSTAFNQSLNEILDRIKYRWSIIDDQLTLTDIYDSGKIKDLETQSITPRYGYNVPELLEQAGIDELYMECFDESLKLYSNLQDVGLEDIASYCALTGHKSRWQFNISALSLAELLKTFQNSSYKHLLDAMEEKIAEVHPLVSEAMRSVNVVMQMPQQASVKEVAPKQKNRVRSKSRSKPRKRSPKPKS